MTGANPTRKNVVRISLFPLFFILLPALEIATFIAVGRQIGVLATLALIFLTSMAGLTLLRVQGLGLLERLRKGIQAGESPEAPLIHGALIVIAGLLLIIPGFLTDIVGFLLFIPAVRDVAWSLAGKHVVRVRPATGAYPGAKTSPYEKTIDLDDDDYSESADPASPWLRHKRD